METTKQDEIKQKIAELRGRYARLRIICGARHINRETAEQYAKELQRLQELLN